MRLELKKQLYITGLGILGIWGILSLVHAASPPPTPTTSTATPSAPGNEAQTLGALLEEEKLPKGAIAALGASEVKLRTLQYASTHPKDSFAVTFLSEDPAKPDNFVLHVKVLDLKKNLWLQTRLDPREAELPFAVIDRIEKKGSLFLITSKNHGRLAPSLVLWEGLKKFRFIPGHIIATMSDKLIYISTQKGPTPIRGFELHVFDLKQKTGFQLFPLRPFQNLRTQQIERVRAAFQEVDPEWFFSHGYPSDPENFNEVLVDDEVIVNEQNHALAFKVKWLGENRDELKYDVPKDLSDVVYVYQHWETRPVFKELLWKDIQAKYGAKVILPDLLVPATLHQILSSK